MNKIKTGDHVIVISGKDKGRAGNVLKVAADGESVLIENINMVKRHSKPNPAKNEPGGIVERESYIHISNVLHYNPVTKKGDRVGVKALQDGNKVRYFKSNGEVVDV
ncbi:MAG: 50S ribosomal protein L24 [Gammaproteobacteria bacterium]|nr:50S ribosomal protein L24 [Gammaproteobacteria bacterium]